MRDPLAGFDEYGRIGQADPRDALTCACEELTATWPYRVSRSHERFR